MAGSLGSVQCFMCPTCGKYFSFRLEKLKDSGVGSIAKTLTEYKLTERDSVLNRLIGNIQVEDCSGCGRAKSKHTP